MKGFRYVEGVSTLRLTVDTCIGCGLCRIVCPHGVFAMEDGKAHALDQDACMECGACAKNCPVGALSVTAGVGCANAIIKGWLTGKPPSCDCGGGACC